MDSRDLVYMVYESGEAPRVPVHFESTDKRHEALLGDVLLCHGWAGVWEDWFVNGGPFRRLEGEGIREWVLRLDVESGYEWPSVDEYVESCLKMFMDNYESAGDRAGELFIVFEVVGPTEYSEYSMMPKRPESGFKLDLAYHRFDFSKLLILSRSKALKLYDKIASYTLEAIKAACELDFIDAVRVADDAFTYTGLIYPKWFMENAYLKWHERFSNEIRRRGKKAIIHTDGDLTSNGMIKRIAELYDGIHPIDVCSKSTVEASMKWVDRVCSARESIGWRTVFHTGVPIDLLMDNEVKTEDVARVVEYFLKKHGSRRLVLSVTHRPYPGRSFSEDLVLEKVNAVRRLVGLEKLLL